MTRDGLNRALTIDLSVRVSDDSFEARLSIPVESTTEQRNGIVKSWLAAIGTALKLTASGEK